MLINRFSELTGLPIKTIRYYIELGLLRPKKKNGFWVFDETCLSDSVRIQRYKDCGFSLKMIDALFSLQCDISLTQRARISAIHELLLAESVKLRQEKKKIQLALRKTKEAIRKQRGSMASFNSNSFPLILITLLHCPYCNHPLEWEEVHIAENRIQRGNGSCQCGFYVLIEEGIVIAQPEKEPYIHVQDSNQDTIKRLASSTVGHYAKYHRWMMNALNTIDLKQKVVFEDVINIVCFLGFFIHELDPDAFYILSDTDINVVRYYMETITRDTPDLNVLFIVDDGVNHPLKKGCLDVIIDRASSDILQRYSYPSQAHTLRNYAHSGTYILGTFSHITKSKRPGKSAIPSLSYPYPYRYNLDVFLSNLQENNVKLLGIRDDAINVDKSAYDGITEEDVLAIRAYWGQYQ